MSMPQPCPALGPFLVVLFLLALVWLLHLFWVLYQSLFWPLSTDLFFLMVLFFLAFRGAACSIISDASKALSKAAFLVILLLQEHRRSPFFLSYCFSRAFPGDFCSTQVLFVEVLFSLVLSMVPLLVLSGSFSVLFLCLLLPSFSSSLPSSSSEWFCSL